MTTCIPSVEESIKQQFAKVFNPADWSLFKDVAESYLQQAAFLRTSDVRARPAMKLLVRNAQKRLFIGIGIELLLKALYLKNGYAINRPTGEKGKLTFPFKFSHAGGSQLDQNQTFMLNDLIEHLEKVTDVKKGGSALKGLKIAKVFRNKEGHFVTAQHAFNPSDYRHIEATLKKLYSIAFSEALTVNFSMAPNEHARWEIRNASQVATD